MATSSTVSASARAVNLYRALRRAHKNHLPSRHMRDLGDAYIRNEFKLHTSKTTTAPPNPQVVQQFFTAWEQYLEQILQTGRAREIRQANNESDMNVAFGKDLPHHIELSPEQKAQLEKLRKETESAMGKGS